MGRLKSYGIFFVGIVLVALGIVLFVKAALGTTPISSMLYVLSLALPFSMGFFNFVTSAMAFAAQLLILGRQFPRFQWFQLPVSLLFSAGIDAWMYALSWITPETLPQQWALMLLACLTMGVGVALEVKGHVIMLPFEAFVNTVAETWNVRFGNVKMIFDWTQVLLAAAFSLYFFGHIEGIREATLISAFSTGFLVKCFLNYLPEWLKRYKVLGIRY